MTTDKTNPAGGASALTDELGMVQLHFKRSKAQEEANKLRHEAKKHLNSLMKVPEGYSSGTTERLVDCIIGAAVLEVVAIITHNGPMKGCE